MRINILKPKLLWKVGDVLMTSGGRPHMICTDHHYYFMIDLVSGEATSEYLSLNALVRALICKTDKKVNATLTLTYWEEL